MRQQLTLSRYSRILICLWFQIQMIGSTMDGAIDFKVDQPNTLLAVKGICDVQSRASRRIDGIGICAGIKQDLHDIDSF